MVLLARKLAAPFSFLARAQWDAETHQRALSSSRDSSADGAFRTLPVCHALAVGAVGHPDTRVYNATQRRLAVGVVGAVSMVGLQARTFFDAKHRTQEPTSQKLHSRRRVEHAAEKHSHRQEQKNRCSNSQGHLPPHPPQASWHSGLSGSWQYRSTSCCVHGALNRPSTPEGVRAARRSHEP
jgi:hypothetical protein